MLVLVIPQTYTSVLFLTYFEISYYFLSLDYFLINWFFENLKKYITFWYASVLVEAEDSQGTGSCMS